MATMTFNRSSGILSWPNFGSWEATSGPFGRGALPAGLYTVSRREITDYTSKTKPPFRDKTGKGFFIPIYPQFPATRGTNARLGIHPDGNVPGTDGCIGIKGGKAKSFYDAIASTPPGANITLLVI